MSDQPNSPNSNSNNRGSGDPGSFNWRLLILLGVAALILGLAFLNNPLGDKKPEDLSYSGFRTYWDQGRILVNDPNDPLTVITTDTSFDAKITGCIEPEKKKSNTSKEHIVHFSVPVNLDLQLEELNNLLGDKLQVETQAPAAPTPPAAPAAEAGAVPPTPAPPTGVEQETLTFAQFRSAFARGEIQINDDPKAKDEVKLKGIGNPLRILVTGDSSQAKIVGTRKYFDNLEIPKDAKGVAMKPTPFVVSVSVAILGDNLGKLIQAGAKYERHKDYFGSILLTFLPILLVLMLLFFLFRHQMKSAGRGALSFGKSKARLLSMDKHKVTFKDVAGIQEAK